MIVKCVGNGLSFITNETVRKRSQRWLGSDGIYNDLDLGKKYLVQAVDYFEGSVFYYLHSVEVSDYPYPYIAELFQIVDSALPVDWEVSFQIDGGKRKLKRLSFSEWANNDMFYEKLIDGEMECVSTYLDHRQ